MPSDPNNLYFCTICSKELSLSEAKTDGDGKAVHAACYIEKLKADVPVPNIENPT